MGNQWKRRGNLYYRTQPGVLSRAATALKRVYRVLYQEWDGWRFYRAQTRAARKVGSGVSS